MLVINRRLFSVYAKYLIYKLLAVPSSVFFVKKKKIQWKRNKDYCCKKNMKVCNPSFDKFTCRRNVALLQTEITERKIPRLIRRKVAIFALMRAQFFFFIATWSANARAFAIFSQWEVLSLRRGTVDFEGSQAPHRCRKSCKMYDNVRAMRGRIVSSSLFTCYDG